MKKFKKTILFFILLFLLTGCNAEVNLYLKDDKIVENINVSEIISDSTFDLNGNLNSNIEDILNSFEVNYTYYDMEQKKNNNSIEKKYNYEISYDNWKDYSIIRKCYDDANIFVDGDIIVVKTSAHYLCGEFYLVDDVILNIYSDFEMINSNADSIKNNVYTWRINKDNYLDHSIELELNMKTEDKSLKKTTKTDKYVNFILLLILIFLLIVISIIFEKVKKSNK